MPKTFTPAKMPKTATVKAPKPKGPKTPTVLKVSKPPHISF